MDVRSEPLIQLDVALAVLRAVLGQRQIGQPFAGLHVDLRQRLCGRGECLCGMIILILGRSVGIASSRDQRIPIGL